MRLRAITELGYTEAPCKILQTQTPAHILRQIAIKDNISFGNDDSDALANEWDKMNWILGDMNFQYSKTLMKMQNLKKTSKAG